MIKKYAKLFIDKNENKMVKIMYSPSQDEYYKIVKEGCTKGYKQIILTSNIMATILKDYFYKCHVEILNIEFMEEDESLKQEINSILTNISEDRAHFAELINTINFLSKESSIDIKKIEMKYKNIENKSIRISIQVNGIYSVNEKYFEDESQRLLRLIGGCLG